MSTPTTTAASVDTSPAAVSLISAALENMGGDNAIDETRTLFLGDLPLSTTAPQLTDLFPALDITHIELKIVNSGESRTCYAFITFGSADQAQLAMDKYEDTTAVFPDGTAVRVCWAKRNSRIHISNLDENTTEADLIGLYSKFGTFHQHEPILVIKKQSTNPQSPNQVVCYGVM